MSPLQKRQKRRLAKRFPPDYRLVLSADEIEVFLEIFEVVERNWKEEDFSALQVIEGWKLSRNAKNPQEVLEVLTRSWPTLHKRADEILMLHYALSGGAPVPRPTRIALARGGLEETTSVALDEREVAVLDFYPREAGKYPRNGTPVEQYDWWNGSLSGLAYNKLVGSAFNLCREHLRIALGLGTPCRSCGNSLVPAQLPGPVDWNDGYLELPLRAHLCEGCIRRELGDRARDWARISPREKAAWLRELQQDL